MKKYEVILQDLEKKIFDEVYTENTLLPSENELSAHYHASRATVRQALKILADNGMIQRRHGYGSLVIPHKKLLFPVTGLISYKELQQSLQFESQTEVLKFEKKKVDAALSVLTAFPIGTEIFHILRRRKIDGKFAILDRDFFRAHLAHGLTLEQACDSVYEYLERDLNLDIAYAQKSITIDLVSADDMNFLDLNPHDRHIVSVVSHVSLADNTLFQFTQSHHQVDKFRFSEFARRQKH